jgi:hypothetical protein
MARPGFLFRLRQSDKSGRRGRSEVKEGIRDSGLGIRKLGTQESDKENKKEVFPEA